MHVMEQHKHEFEYCKQVEMSKISKMLPFTVEVDYTVEALEVMKESEREVREEMEEKIDEV
jgi:hypothetical protein